MAEITATRMVAVAAIAVALTGAAIAGGVAAGSAGGHGDPTGSSTGPRGSVASAAVVRTTLATTVQVGGAIGYEGSYSVIIPSGRRPNRWPRPGSSSPRRKRPWPTTRP